MSSNAHAHDAHGHGHGGADHVPHVLPLNVYFKTYISLLVLTALTVGASFLKLGDTGGLILALMVATVKASIVALVFMHLYWDQKFFAIIFASSVLFLAIFLAFTMFDTNARGVADPWEAEKPADYKVPFGGTQSDLRRKEEAEASVKAFQEHMKLDPRYVPGATPAAAPGAAPAGAPGAAPVAPGAAPAPVAPGAAPAAAPGAAPGAAPAAGAPGAAPAPAPAPAAPGAAPAPAPAPVPPAK
jgi:cytochrome c oxidase subunit 4